MKVADLNLGKNKQDEDATTDSHVSGLLNELAKVKIDFAEAQAKLAQYETQRAMQSEPDGTENEPGNRVEWFKLALERNEQAVEAERAARHELSRSLQHKVDRVREDAERRVQHLRMQIKTQEASLKELHDSAGEVEEKFGEQIFRVLSEMRILGKNRVAILDFGRVSLFFSEIWREIGF